jgi:endonuclease/exonuclease/phosphatase family metal-dependent hydrolase
MQYLKVMTYNIHYGVGRDNRYRLDRIIAIIKNEDPDVVALQEVDKNLSRTNFDDQPRIIADALGMHFHHCVNRRIGDGEFGIATLSRFPIWENQRYDLSFQPRFRIRYIEPRGALHSDIILHSAHLHVFNVHLGLSIRERIYQRRKLLSESILLNGTLQKPTVILGDFNDRPISVVNLPIQSYFHDVFKLSGCRDGATFRWGPIKLRLDRIYVSSQIHPIKAYISNTPLSRLASDHMPLITVAEVKGISNGTPY